MVSANGADFASREAVRGDAVVLVHGSVSDLRCWSRTVEALGHTHRAIAYSRRYARPNAEIAEGSDDPLHAHVDDLASLIATWQADPAHLVGHSLGGFIALLTAIRYPSAVRSLVLIEPPVLTLVTDVPPSPRNVAQLLFSDPGMLLAVLRFAAGTIAPAQRAFRRGDDKAAISALGNGILGPRSFRQLSPERYAQVWENRRPERAQLLGEGFPPLAAEVVRSVTHPTLLLRGAESPPLFRRLSLHLLALLPNAKCEVVPAASHIVHEDAPSATIASLRRFLADPAAQDVRDPI